MQKINCPACGHGFHAEEVISQKLTRELEKQLQIPMIKIKPFFLFMVIQG